GSAPVRAGPEEPAPGRRRPRSPGPVQRIGPPTATFVGKRRYRGQISSLPSAEEPTVTMQRHPSNKAKSGPPPDRPPSPAPPPPPRWRSWLLPIGLLLSLVLLLVPNQMLESQVTELTYAPELQEKIAARN